MLKPGGVVLTSDEAEDPWDDEHLRDRKPAGMSPRAFLVVVLVIAMLLAVNLYALLALVELPGEGKQPEGPPEHPWNQTIEAQVIEGEEVWEGRKGHLDAPVVVPSGAKLTLRDCELTLSTLDLVWNRVPYFLVEEGGKLQMENSKVHLNHDRLLDDCFLGPYYNDRHLPYISRVVNLEGTEDPMVEFELRWRWEGTELAVGVQPTPESDIRLLNTITPEEAFSSAWKTFRFSLSEYALMTPRVVLYFPTPPQDVVLISRLRVTDGGEDLPHDEPHTAEFYLESWDRKCFLTFDNAFNWYGRNSTLIHSGGTARISDSVLSASRGVIRSGNTDYIKQEYHSRYPTYNTWAACRNWHVRVEGGTLMLDRTLMDNVPLIASGSRVEVTDCMFALGTDMVTLYNTTGNITDTRFHGENAPPVLWLAGENRSVWAVSVESNTDEGLVTITGCDFHDMPVGVDTGDAWVELRDNAFNNITRLAVWDHRSDGMDGWDAVKANNTFSACEGFLYVQTKATAVSFKDEVHDIGWTSEMPVDDQGEQIMQWEIHPQMYSFKQIEEYGGTVNRPEVMVRGDGTVRRLGNITVNLYAEVSIYYTKRPHVGGEAEFVVESGMVALEVDLATQIVREETPRWKDIYAEVSLTRFQPRPDEGEGVYNVSLLVGFRSLWADNLTLDLVLDGQLERRFNMTEIEEAFVYQDSGLFDHLIRFDAGEHELNVVLSGNVFVDEHNLSEEPVEIANDSLDIMRADAGMPADLVKGFIEGHGEFLLLDPNATFAIEDLEVVGDEDTWSQYLHVIGGPGSSLDLVNPVGAEWVSLYIYYDGYVDLAVQGGELSYLNIEMEEYIWWVMGTVRPEMYGSIEIDGLACGGLEVTSWSRAIRMRDVDAEWHISCSAYNTSSLEMNGCSIAEGGGSVWGAFSYVRLSNCTFHSPEPATLRITAYTPELEVRDCDLDGVQMSVLVDFIHEWSLNVTGCEFHGEGGVLSVLWLRPTSQDLPNSDFPVPEGTIEGNLFTGRRTGLVLHHTLFRDLLGENELAEGARAFAWYLPDIRVRQQDGIHQEAYYGLVPRDWLLHRYPFGLDWYEDSLQDQLFLDVTEDPSKAYRPDPLDVFITGWSDAYSVMDFWSVDPRDDLIELPYIPWPSTEIGLREILEADWPWPLRPYKG